MLAAIPTGKHARRVKPFMGYDAPSQAECILRSKGVCDAPPYCPHHNPQMYASVYAAHR